MLLAIIIICFENSKVQAVMNDATSMVSMDASHSEIWLVATLSISVGLHNFPKITNTVNYA